MRDVDVAADVRRAIGGARLTLMVAALTAAVSVAGLLDAGVRESLQRRPGELGDGEPWRLVSSLLVHDGWLPLVSNLVVLVLVGAAVESIVNRRGWLALYLAGGISGQLAGLRWEPSGAGSSVAWCGLLGALAVSVLRRGDDGRAPGPDLTTLGLAAGALTLVVLAAGEAGSPLAAAAVAVVAWTVGANVARVRAASGRVPVPPVWLAGAVLVLAVALVATTNLHGPPVLAGAALALGAGPSM